MARRFPVPYLTNRTCPVKQLERACALGRRGEGWGGDGTLGLVAFIIPLAAAIAPRTAETGLRLALAAV